MLSRSPSGFSMNGLMQDSSRDSFSFRSNREAIRAASSVTSDSGAFGG
jgi:hypothetical protein